METPVVVCLTPVRNEAWILERFLHAASVWADVIIVADQQSDDGSREIVGRFPKARLVENFATNYDEGARQRILLEAARNIPGNRFLVALDADEFLTPGAWSTEEWRATLASDPGTVVRFPWLNVTPDLKHFWRSAPPMPFGFMDDGSDHSGAWIHSERIPARDECPQVELRETSVLHLQYTDWGRMESKHRWYQCLERLRSPRRSAIDIYRQYHHMDAVSEDQRLPLPAAWVLGYRAIGIDLAPTAPQPPYRFDLEVLRIFEKHGTRRFSREAVWEVDWPALATQFGLPRPDRFADPRSSVEKRVHRWLRTTQAMPNHTVVRWQERLLRRVMGW